MFKRWKLRREMGRHAKAGEWLEVYRLAKQLGDKNEGLYAMCAAIQATRQALGEED